MKKYLKIAAKNFRRFAEDIDNLPPRHFEDLILCGLGSVLVIIMIMTPIWSAQIKW